MCTTKFTSRTKPQLLQAKKRKLLKLLLPWADIEDLRLTSRRLLKIGLSLKMKKLLTKQHWAYYSALTSGTLPTPSSKKTSRLSSIRSSLTSNSRWSAEFPSSNLWKPLTIITDGFTKDRQRSLHASSTFTGMSLRKFTPSLKQSSTGSAGSLTPCTTFHRSMETTEISRLASTQMSRLFLQELPDLWWAFFPWWRLQIWCD